MKQAMVKEPRTEEQYIATFGPLGFKWEAPNGSVPPPADRGDAAWLDFSEGMRRLQWQEIEPQLEPAYAAAVETFRREKGRDPQSVDEIHEVVDHLEAFQWRNFLFRIVQETKWNLVVDSYDRKFEELVAELDESDNRGPGSVSWDPNFEYPDYARHEIHLQPGGYIEHPLAGYHYHINTNIGFVGLNNNDGVQRSLVKQLPEPDGGVSRILDLGCSIGQSTTCLKERFPNAEIWGIDLSAPMVRYAHRRAVHFDSDVHFAQMLVEDLKFPDNHFDVVYAYILFHELPAEISRQAIKEAYRVLRPGGIFNVFDFGKDRYRSGTPYNTYLLRYMVEHNNEVYAEEFCTMDFEGDCERAGFSRVSETSTNGISQIVATK